MRGEVRRFLAEGLSLRNITWQIDGVEVEVGTTVNINQLKAICLEIPLRVNVY